MAPGHSPSASHTQLGPVTTRPAAPGAEGGLGGPAEQPNTWREPPVCPRHAPGSVSLLLHATYTWGSDPGVGVHSSVAIGDGHPSHKGLGVGSGHQGPHQSSAGPAGPRTAWAPTALGTEGSLIRVPATPPSLPAVPEPTSRHHCPPPHFSARSRKPVLLRKRRCQRSDSTLQWELSRGGSAAGSSTQGPSGQLPLRRQSLVSAGPSPKCHALLSVPRRNRARTDPLQPAHRVATEADVLPP